MTITMFININICAFSFQKTNDNFYFENFDVHTRMYKKSGFKQNKPDARRDQEEGGELDSHEETSPEEIKSREMELGLRVGLLLLSVS